MNHIYKLKRKTVNISWSSCRTNKRNL